MVAGIACRLLTWKSWRNWKQSDCSLSFCIQILCHVQQFSLAWCILPYLLCYFYILLLVDLFSFCHIPLIQQFPVRSSLTCSFLLKNDTYWNKTSHILLRNADKPSIQPDSTTPGKIHHGLSQSYVNSYCRQARDTQCYIASSRVTSTREKLLPQQ